MSDTTVTEYVWFFSLDNGEYYQIQSVHKTEAGAKQALIDYVNTEFILPRRDYTIAEYEQVIALAKVEAYDSQISRELLGD